MSKGDEGKTKTPKVDGLAVFPTVSMGENPGNGHNSAYLHPCETAKWIGALLEREDSKVDNVKYIESFIMLCSSVVEMRPGSKGGLGSTEKVTSFNGQNQSGQDVDITTVPFADLIKRLPNVKVSFRISSRDSLSNSHILLSVGGGRGASCRHNSRSLAGIADAA